MSYRTAAAVVAGIVLALGVLLGVLPHSVADGSPGGIGCGSAFSSTDVGSAADAGALYGQGLVTDYGQRCSDALAGPRVAAWVLVGVGGVVLLFVTLTSMTRAAPVAERDGDDART